MFVIVTCKKSGMSKILYIIRVINVTDFENQAPSTPHHCGTHSETSKGCTIHTVNKH